MLLHSPTHLHHRCTSTCPPAGTINIDNIAAYGRGGKTADFAFSELTLIPKLRKGSNFCPLLASLFSLAGRRISHTACATFRPPVRPEAISPFPHRVSLWALRTHLISSPADCALSLSLSLSLSVSL